MGRVTMVAALFLLLVVSLEAARSPGGGSSSAAGAASFAAPATAAAPLPPPGQLFDLRNWDLQLPLSNGKGGVQSVRWPALRDYTSPYFFTNATTRGMQFWAPISGAHTVGSRFPRSELRERPNWTFAGRNELNATLMVLAAPGTGKVAVGQVHVDAPRGEGKSSCAVVLELIWASGKLVSHVRTPTCDNVNMPAPGTFPLGTPFSYSIRVTGKVVSLWTSKGAIADYNYSWMNTSVPIYFKAGAYTQESGDSDDVGGGVLFSALSVTHAP